MSYFFTSIANSKFIKNEIFSLLRFSIEMDHPQKRVFQEPLNILLVEDDVVDIMNVQRAFKLKQIHFPLAIAQNGLEALKQLQASVKAKDTASLLSQRRIIILDLNMPRMNGFEFLKLLRQEPILNRIPVVVLVNYWSFCKVS